MKEQIQVPRNAIKLIFYDDDPGDVDANADDAGGHESGWQVDAFDEYENFAISGWEDDGGQNSGR